MRKKELTFISLNVIRLVGRGRARPFSSRDATGRTELASEVAGGSVDGKLLHEEEAFVEAGDESVGRVGISIERGTGACRFRAEESGDGAVEVGTVKIFGVDDKILDENRHSVVHEQSRGEEGDGEGEGLQLEPSREGADNGPTDTRPDGLVASARGVEEAKDDGGVNWLPSQVRDEHGPSTQKGLEVEPIRGGEILTGSGRLESNLEMEQVLIVGRREDEEGRQWQVDIQEDGSGEGELKVVDGPSSRRDLDTQGDHNAGVCEGGGPEAFVLLHRIDLPFRRELGHGEEAVEKKLNQKRKCRSW